jgi:hypothetical protein
MIDFSGAFAVAFAVAVAFAFASLLIVSLVKLLQSVRCPSLDSGDNEQIII